MHTSPVFQENLAFGKESGSKEVIV